jgi:hypothetical protein
LRKHQTEFQTLDAEVLVVTFDNDFLAAAYVESTRLDWPLLLDQNRELYEAYAMEHLSWWGHFNPVSITKYLGLTSRGFLPGKPGADWQQLGGDVLLDPGWIIRMLYRSRSPHDRPSVTSILSVIKGN